MSTRFQQFALLFAAATVIFLGSRVCGRLLAQTPPPVPVDESAQSAQPSGGPQLAAGGQQAGPEVLTRGPIHEAFAEVISYNPQPGPVAAKEPPKAIEEVPPAEKPQGDYAWIPGYWSWDHDRNEFIWVTGVWRIPPPGTNWVPGYWNQTANGHQWVGGYWGPANTAMAGQPTGQATAETTYYPAPPGSVESVRARPLPRPTIFGSPATGIGSTDDTPGGPAIGLVASRIGSTFPPATSGPPAATFSLPGIGILRWRNAAWSSARSTFPTPTRFRQRTATARACASKRRC